MQREGFDLDRLYINNVTDRPAGCGRQTGDIDQAVRLFFDTGRRNNRPHISVPVKQRGVGESLAYLGPAGRPAVRRVNAGDRRKRGWRGQ